MKRTSRQITQEREQEAFDAESNSGDESRDLKRRKQDGNDDVAHSLSSTKRGKRTELQSALGDSTAFEPDAPQTKSPALTPSESTQPKQPKRKAPEDGANEPRGSKRKRIGEGNGTPSQPSTTRLPNKKDSQPRSPELTQSQLDQPGVHLDILPREQHSTVGLNSGKRQSQASTGSKIQKPTKTQSAPTTTSSKTKTVAHGQIPGSKTIRKTGLHTNLPPIHNITRIFEDLTTNGIENLGLRDAVARLKNRPLRVATMCSGTESPLLALQMIRDGMFPIFSEVYTTLH